MLPTTNSNSDIHKSEDCPCNKLDNFHDSLSTNRNINPHPCHTHVSLNTVAFNIAIAEKQAMFNYRKSPSTDLTPNLISPLSFRTNVLHLPKDIIQGSSHLRV